ncbi:CHAT domain-containing protein [Streptomyces sp. RKAG293]|uniref:CHAT domain-containing protein n=1 Tax=Streptomyces sp. RKAG293 TaxID=2893403 RepID=UPI0020347C66|nr:CHAT domain-containing protein [Streptomyces sp. RKAG293]MCM2422175.1 CHAT domain-containing protein [Streptomyces sp. RKAG293]
MSDVRAVVDRTLVRCEATWSPEIERLVGGAGGYPAGWLPAAARLLHLSWNGGGRAPAIAATALMEYALDVGPRNHVRRPSWVMHLWLAERTLSRLYADYQLSGDVRHYLAAQIQGRTPDDPVAVAAAYSDRPFPRHGQAVEPIEHHAAQLAADLPPGDLGRCSLLVRLAQAAAFRHESGDASALPELWHRARAAHEAVTSDHLEAELVGRSAVHAALTWFRAHGRDYGAVEFAVDAGRTALAAVERARSHGFRDNPHDVSAVHLMLAMALMSSLRRTLDTATIEEAMEHLERFRALGPPDDQGVYAANMASLLTGRAILSGSREDVARADGLWEQLQRGLPPGHMLLPHIEQKRAACARMPRLMRMLPFNPATPLKRLSPMLGSLFPVPDLPPITVSAPMDSPGYASPGPGPEEFAAFLGTGARPPRTRRAPSGAAPGPPPGGTSTFAPSAEAATFRWPPGPPATAGPPDPQLPSDMAGLPAEAEEVFHGLSGVNDIALDPRRLALAERQLRERLGDPALEHGRRGWTATVLMSVLVVQYTLSEDTALLLAAVRQGDEILATLPPTSSRYIDLLCAVEDKRSAIGGLYEDEATLVRACDALRWAVERVPEDSATWIGCAIPYAQALTHVAMMRQEPGKARQARHILDTAAARLDALLITAGPAGQHLQKVRPVLAQIMDLADLADAELRGDVYAVEETDSTWSPETEALLPPTARFESARMVLGRAIERRDWGLATDAAAVALEMLPLLTSPALHRDDRQAVARRALLGRRHPGTLTAGPAVDVPDQIAGTSLGRTGCAVALAAGRTEQAAVLLELGRAVLMSQDLEARGDVSDLAAVHPSLADAFAVLSARLLDHQDTREDERSGRVREQHEVAEQWRRLLDDIRRHPGFETFLRAPTVEQMRAEAAEGPIALINVDRLRCDALVVTGDAVLRVPLDITEGLLAYTAREFLAAAAVGRDASATRQQEAQETVFATLELLWDRVARPVLDAAGLTEPIPGGTPSAEVPRLWWSASGPLAHLPLHAAGYHRQEDVAARRSVLDRVASSYTPGIRALSHARQAPVARGLAGQYLAVGQPTGENGSAGASAREIAAVARTLTGLRVLDGATARVDTVLAALPYAAIVHFACHGISDPADPSRSRLELADGPLEVTGVARQRLPRAQLAVLLACHTARTDRLPDEAIHLTSAFQTAGYPQVVGALWEAADLVSVRLAGHLYRSLRRYGGGLDVADTGRALNGIVRDLRKRYPRSPAVWAPYVHTGR